MKNEVEKKYVLLFVLLALQNREYVHLLAVMGNLLNFFICLLRERRRHQMKKRQIRTLPRPQGWFKEMLENPVHNLSWKKHFRIERGTFDYICNLVRDDMQMQQNHMRRTFTVEEYDVRYGDWLLVIAIEVVAFNLAWGNQQLFLLLINF